MIIRKKYDNGFEYIEIKNNQAEAKIALQGAHLFHYKVKDKPALLWLSKMAYFEKAKAIRGGIPICFPWFGKNEDNPTLPQHGFARTELWTVVLEEEKDAHHTHIRLQLQPNSYTLEQWPYLFDLYLDITISDTLIIALTMTNIDTKPFEISAALHTYFSISDINTISIKGLDAKAYYNALNGNTYIQQGDIIIEEEVDRVYFYSSEIVTLLDGHFRVNIHQEGSNSLVVWNPWREKSKQMSDMPDDGYKSMICLETSNAREDARTLNVNESHVIRAIISQCESA